MGLFEVRILHAFKVYHPTEGGIQKSIRVLINSLKEQFDFEVLVCKHKGWGMAEKVDGIKVTRSTTLFELFSMPIAPWFMIQFWYKAHKADLVVNHHPFPLNDLAIAIYFPKKTKLVIHWHSDIIEQKRLSRVLKPFIVRSLKRADKIIVSSQEMIEYSDYLNPFAEKCKVIPYGLNVEFFSVLNQQELQQTKTLREKFPGKLVLSVGRLVKYKGYKYLIEAAKAIDATFLVIGEGPLKESLQRKINRAGLSDRFILLGQLNEQQKKIYYHACDVFVLPSISRNEAFGLSQIEAMASGKAVINTDVKSSVSSVARNKLEGLTVPVRDSTTLIEVLQLLLSKENYSTELANAGKIRARERFSASVFGQSMAKVYAELSVI